MKPIITQEEVEKIIEDTRRALELPLSADLSYIDAETLGSDPTEFTELQSSNTIYGHNVKKRLIKGQAGWAISGGYSVGDGCKGSPMVLQYTSWKFTNNGWCVVGKDARYIFNKIA